MNEYTIPSLSEGEENLKVTSMAPIENGGFIVSFNREGFGTLDINETDNSIKVKLFNINPLKNES